MKNNDGRYSALTFTLFVTALGAAYLVSGCNHSPLGRKPDAQSSAPSATVTSTQTSSDTDTAIDAPAPVLPPVSSPQDECVKRMGYWDSDIDSCRDTQPETKSTTATSTGTATSTAVDASVDDSYKKKAAVPFKILSVKVDKVDALGHPAEDVRSFGINFNEPAMNVELTVLEDRERGSIVHHEYIGHAPESLYISPGRWNGKLRSNTDYKWVVTANADMTVMDGIGSGDSATGTFKTIYCFVGEWKYHYTPDAITDGIGKCHGAMMQCVDNGKGAGMLSGAGEVTPYPWGDIVGNGVDDDCNGIVDGGRTYFCPVNDSTVSQGCCVADGATFERISKSYQNGTLIRGTDFEMVYWYASNGKRYTFPNKDVLVSWFETEQGLLDGASTACNGVKQMPEMDLSYILLGGSVTIKPGTYLVKIAADPKLFVVSRGKVLRPLASAELAEKIYPGTSEKRIRTIPEAFFTMYTMGKTVNTVSDYDPLAESSVGIEAEIGIDK